MQVWKREAVQNFSVQSKATQRMPVQTPLTQTAKAVRLIRKWVRNRYEQKYIIKNKQTMQHNFICRILNEVAISSGELGKGITFKKLFLKFYFNR